MDSTALDSTALEKSSRLLSCDFMNQPEIQMDRFKALQFCSDEEGRLVLAKALELSGGWLTSEFISKAMDQVLTLQPETT